MLKIKIQLFGRLGANLGSEIVLEFQKSPTIYEVIQKLIKNDPALESLLLKEDRLSKGTIILLNGKPFAFKSNLGLKTQLFPKDQLTIDRIGFLEIVGGG